MGYRVGGQCFADLEKASDYKMSLVVPAITQDGTLKVPVRKDDGWYFPVMGVNYQAHFVKVELTHPYCDETEYFKDGVMVGFLILGLFVIVHSINMIIGLLNGLKTSGVE